MKADHPTPKDPFTEERENGICSSFLRKLSLTRDREKRLRVIKAYARLNTPWAERLLVEALADPCEIIRDFLVQELAHRERFNLSLACARMLHPPWYAKSALLRILGMRKAGTALRAIEIVLDDPNTDVRKSAAETLGEIGGREAIRLLVRLSKDKNQYVRAAAEEAIRKASDLRFSG